MLEIWRNGGFPMYFILVFGLAALGTAFAFALRPETGQERFVRAMAQETLYSVLAGTCADLAAVGNYIGSHPLGGVELAKLTVEGVGESMSPGILGFPLLSLTAMLLAVGRRRLPRLAPTNG